MGVSGRAAARSASSCASSRVRAPPPQASGLRKGFSVGSPVHHAHQRKRFRLVLASANTPREIAAGAFGGARLGTRALWRDLGEPLTPTLSPLRRERESVCSLHMRALFLLLLTSGCATGLTAARRA